MEINIKKFSAKLCPPCKKMAPEIGKLKEAHKDWIIDEIDIDSNREESEKYDVEYVPTLIITQRGKMKRLVGFKTKEEIERVIKEMGV